MLDWLKTVSGDGGRKYRLVLITILIAVVNEVLKLGVSQDTIDACLLAAVGGSGTIALEDGLKALFGAKTAPGKGSDLTQEDESK